MIDWILDHVLTIWIIICLLGFAALGAGVWRQIQAERRDHERACAHLWRLSQTHDDTVKITMRCELGDESSTTVVPVPIFLPSGR